ncbi:MAG: uracil-DNA glycosylase [Deltaproteobacteria bacterium]|nr:uracil-DNA glycosylase [Deltaproteobacteria bacterium]
MTNQPNELNRLQQQVIACRKCARLVAYRRELLQKIPRRFQDWTYWSQPLPSFGDPQARVLIVGLAPAAQGGNRTGRMFTGDRSGDWLFEALHRFGFANRPTSEKVDDGLLLKDIYITATIRCAPPQNKPLPEEIEACRPYFQRELDLLERVRVFIPLGQVAVQQLLKNLKAKGLILPALKFGHGQVYPLPDGRVMVASYHPSQQNTFTGKLTRDMFYRVFEQARRLLIAPG